MFVTSEISSIAMDSNEISDLEKLLASLSHISLIIHRPFVVYGQLSIGLWPVIIGQLWSMDLKQVALHGLV